MGEGVFMKKGYSKWIVTIIAMVLLLMPLKSFAAKTVSFFDGQMTITDSGNNGSGTLESYVITAKGSLFSKAKNTITIANETETDAKISFTYSVSNANSFTIAGAAASTNGNYLAILGGGEGITIVLQSKSGLSDTTATLTLTNITYAHMVESSEITFDFDSSFGTVTADGEAISSGSTITVGEEGAEIVATPATDVVFVGWVDEDDKIVSQNRSYTQQSIGNITVRALFSRNTPYFMADNIYICSDLNEAASKGNNLVLVCDGVLLEGDYEIPAGDTLLIPFDAENTIYTTVPGASNDKYADPKLYRKLTMASGAKITVNGAISVSAKQSCSQGTTASPIGTYGLIDMKDGSEMTVNSDGRLYAWGYITGSGKITAKSGATVYEDFQVRDWRGGSAVTDDMLNNSQRVFLMSQYYVQNIEVPLTLEAGAVENGYMSVYVTGSDLLGGSPIQGSSVPFIGSNGMFKIVNGSITKDYDEETDRLIIDIDGTLDMAPLSISMKISLIGTQTVNSKNYTLPINGNITLHVNSGSKVNISQELALLPGGVINVYEGAECTFGSGAKVFIYDSDNWGNYCGHTNQKLMPVKYSPSRQYTRTEVDLVDAEVYIEGLIDAYNGYVYTTAAGAYIHGAEGGSVKLKSDTKTTITYQASQNNTSVSFVEIPITYAKPQNADGTYTDPAVLGDCCSTYIYSDGAWIPQTINHTNVVETEAVEPTCDEDGTTESSYCSNCGTIIKEQEVLSAIGHDYGEYVFDDKVNHKKVCANDSNHVITEPHTFVGFNCSVCGCKKIVTDTYYTINGEEIVINTSLVLEESPNTQIIIATYDSSDRLLDTAKSAANALEEVSLSSIGVAKIKVFAWGGFDVMNPVSCVEEIVL